MPLYVLHSSVDIDDCMAALMGEDGAPVRHCRSNLAVGLTTQLLAPVIYYAKILQHATCRTASFNAKP